jgi:hypothetical protein
MLEDIRNSARTPREIHLCEGRYLYEYFPHKEKSHCPASSPKEPARTLMAAIIVKALAWLLRFLLERVVVNTLADPAMITQFAVRYAASRLRFVDLLGGKQCRKLFSRGQEGSAGVSSLESRHALEKVTFLYTRRVGTHAHVRAQTYLL